MFSHVLVGSAFVEPDVVNVVAAIVVIGVIIVIVIVGFEEERSRRTRRRREVEEEAEEEEKGGGHRRHRHLSKVSVSFPGLPKFGEVFYFLKVSLRYQCLNDRSPKVSCCLTGVVTSTLRA